MIQIHTHNSRAYRTEYGHGTPPIPITLYSLKEIPFIMFDSPEDAAYEAGRRGLV